jgi:hypothetical protein
VREAIEAAAARLLYLPPYSPDFNPIENMWSKSSRPCAACARAPRPNCWRPPAWLLTPFHLRIASVSFCMPNTLHDLWNSSNASVYRHQFSSIRR